MYFNRNREAMKSYLIEVRGLKLKIHNACFLKFESYLIEVRGLKPEFLVTMLKQWLVVSYRGTWVETACLSGTLIVATVVSYRGTWVETIMVGSSINVKAVVSYRGTWVETYLMNSLYLTMIGSYLIEVRGLKHQLKGHFD